MCLDDSCEEKTDRRSFLMGASAALAGLTIFGGSTSDAQGVQAPTRVLDDPRVQHGKVTFSHGGRDTINGFLARPKAEGSYRAVLVVAGNRISEEYIPNTCAALALAGFVGLAPDIFHLLPDSARTPAEMREALANHSDLDVLADVQAGADYLNGKPYVRLGAIGVIGFCYGGRIAMLHGARSRDVDAVIPYHPGPVTAAEVQRLSVPVQVHCGTSDRNVSVDAMRSLEHMLRAQSTPVDLHLYEGADHGFLAYTRPTYNVGAARLSWSRSVEFLRKHLAS